MIWRCKWFLYGEGYGISGVMYIRNEIILKEYVGYRCLVKEDFGEKGRTLK